MKKIILFFLTGLTFFSINSIGQKKVADAVNNGATEVQSTLNEVNSSIGTLNNAAATAKALGGFVGLRKKKNKKSEADGKNVALDSVSNSAVTVVLFDKIDYMQMKQIKDELVKNGQIKDVKINYNTDGKNFLLIQHETDTDKILEAILTKWGDRYDVLSMNADGIALKKK